MNKIAKAIIPINIIFYTTGIAILFYTTNVILKKYLTFSKAFNPLKQTLAPILENISKGLNILNIILIIFLILNIYGAFQMRKG